MRDDEIITFEFAGLWASELTIARCRELCPEETAALEEAVEEMERVGGRKAMQALGKVGGEVGKQLEALRLALIEEARHRARWGSFSDPPHGNW